MKDSATIINEKRYIKSKEVWLDENGPRYQEFLSADIMNPEVIYVASDIITRNGGGNISSVVYEESHLHTALREKYTGKELLYGDFNVQGNTKSNKINRKDFIKTGLIWCAGVTLLGVQSCEKEETFLQNDYLQELFESDIKEFSANAAKNIVIQDIFKRRGISRVEEWYLNKLRGKAGYYYNPEQDSFGKYYLGSDKIVWQSYDISNRRRSRGHEMGHKVSAEIISSSKKRTGFLVGKKSWGKWTYNGRGFNEGGTEDKATVHISSQFDDKFVRESGYANEAEFYRLVRNKFGCDKIMRESFVFDPKILEKEFNQRLNDKAAFATFLKEVDEFHELSNARKDISAKKNEIMQIINSL